jgi:hypothetical protein
MGSDLKGSDTGDRFQKPHIINSPNRKLIFRSELRSSAFLEVRSVEEKKPDQKYHNLRRQCTLKWGHDGEILPVK